MYTNKASLDSITELENPQELLKYIFTEDKYDYDLLNDFYFSEYIYFNLDDFYADNDEDKDDFDAYTAMEERMDDVEKEYTNFGWLTSRFEDGDNYHFIAYPKKNKKIVDILVKLINT